jgi:uncharacterized protein (TIRG00374 family)
MIASVTTMPGATRVHRVEWAARLVVLAVGTVAVVQLLRGTDLVHARALVERAGWPLLLVLLPTAVAMGVDAQGWRYILRALGQDVGWPALVRARLAVESIVLAAPGGPVAGEALKVGLLRWRANVPLAAGAASLALTKACLWGGESIYLLTASAALSMGSLSATPKGRALLPLTVAGAAIVGALAVLAFAVLRDGALATRLGTVLARVPWARFRAWIEGRRSDLVTVDRAATSFFAAPRSLRLRALGAFTLEWLIEGLETLLILRCIGVVINVGDALALDGVTSLLRAAAFFVPAGLGVQDVSQLLLLRALGVPDASAAAAALIFIKRTKEVFWVFTGSLFFAGSSSRES